MNNDNNDIITLDQLQKEVGEWSRRNFPNNKPHHPLLGIIEEIGEFRQSKQNNVNEAEDAIGDMLIYSADYCERNGLNLGKICSVLDFAPFLNDDTQAVCIITIGKLCHFHLKGEQGIRYSVEDIISNKEKYLVTLISCIVYVAGVNNLDWKEAYNKTWLKVKQRDWQKNPINAAKLVE